MTWNIIMLWAITIYAFWYVWRQEKVPGFVLIVGFALILWADSVCDFFKLEYGINTVRIFLSTTILLLVISKSKRGKRMVQLVKGQLGY